MLPVSNNSTENPFPHQYTSSSFHNSSPFLGLNGNQILLHQYYQNQFSSHYLAKNMLFSPNNQDHCDNSSRSSFPIKKIPKKRERSCSKILTAQGPRDRRVRLSITMARKFFDLQELLGFEKPSKTVDWLFTHSKVAIDELTNWSTRQAHHPKISGATNDEGGSERNLKREKEKEEVPLKELRAKARARARERTIKKMWGKIETTHRSDNSFGEKDIRVMEEEFLKKKLQANKEIIEGSGVTKIKMKPSFNLGFHPNPYSPIESGTCNGTSSINNGNWDITSLEQGFHNC